MASGAPRALCAALFGCVLGIVAGAGCEAIVGIPDVTLEADGDVGDASGSGEASGDAAGCGHVGADGAVRSGPDMVRIDAVNGSYCIDTTEVTIGQFNAYVEATSGVLVDVPDVCANALPTPPVDSTDDPQKPVANLGECHAGSYCRWAGKRLCGMIGDGGSVSAGAIPLDTEWVYACANGEMNDPYPYGAAYQAQTCNVDDADGGVVPVKSRSGCHGTTPPFDQIYDMVGNVWELTNSFGGANGTVAHPAGGAWDTTQADLSAGGCFYVQNFDGVISDVAESGFRCCADP